jgi:predicted protein tyrosine phosphatase
VKRVLFVCSRNQLRSPTAEQVFSTWPGMEVASAGLDPISNVPVSPELLEWADIIFVMERVQRNKLSKKFRAYLKNQRVIVLGIADDYEYMDPALVRLFEKLVPPHLGMAESARKLYPVMNNTKWEEIHVAMLELDSLSPKWRTKDRETGFVCPWDGEWFYHFREGGYESIEWVEIGVTSPEQDHEVEAVLAKIHVPGHRTAEGFRVYGYQEAGVALAYLGD